MTREQIAWLLAALLCLVAVGTGIVATWFTKTPSPVSAALVAVSAALCYRILVPPLK
jgi:hypothetical protein